MHEWLHDFRLNQRFLKKNSWLRMPFVAALFFKEMKYQKTFILAFEANSALSCQNGLFSAFYLIMYNSSLLRISIFQMLQKTLLLLIVVVSMNHWHFREFCTFLSAFNSLWFGWSVAKYFSLLLYDSNAGEWCSTRVNRRLHS